MIQLQIWADSRRLLIVDERNHGSVQVVIPNADVEDNRLRGKADALICCLWVDEGYRRQGSAAYMLEAAEREARRLGCKSVCLEWDIRESPEWVERWYQRLGYEVREFGRGCSLLVKKLRPAT